jgi:hypothetical protein
LHSNKLKKWLVKALVLCTCTFVVLFCVLASWIIMYEGTGLIMELPHERHIKITFSLALAMTLLWLQMLAIDSALWMQKAGLSRINENDYGDDL